MSVPSHLPDKAYFDGLPAPTKEEPLRILFSACLGGVLCGYDGTNNGEYAFIPELLRHPYVKAVLFCPEDYSFGTPRGLPNIHGGTGYDVLDGKARVLTENGEDFTEGMIHAAEKMLEVARQQKVHLALLMDVSGACGSQVIYDGHRTTPTVQYQVGAGVSAALLMRNGIKVMSQRDYKTMQLLLQKLNPEHSIDKAALDHHETAWYKSYFKK